MSTSHLSPALCGTVLQPLLQWQRALHMPHVTVVLRRVQTAGGDRFAPRDVVRLDPLRHPPSPTSWQAPQKVKFELVRLAPEGHKDFRPQVGDDVEVYPDPYADFAISTARCQPADRF